MSRASFGDGPVEDRARLDRRAELAAADREDAAAATNLFFLRRERHGLIRFALRDVGDRRVESGSNVNSSPSLASATASGHCTTCRPEVERVATEDVAHVVAADDDHLEPDFFGDALQSGRTHLARRADREPVAGDDERLAAMHARAEVRHEIAERARLPALVERVEALRHAIGGRRDLIGVDRVELLRAGRRLRIPENQRATAHQRPRPSTAPAGAAGCGRSFTVTPGFSRAGAMAMHRWTHRTPEIHLNRDRALVAAAGDDRERRIAGKARVGARPLAEHEAAAAIVRITACHVRHEAHRPSGRLSVAAAFPSIVHDGPMFTSEATTRGVRVSVVSEYAPDRSQAAEARVVLPLHDHDRQRGPRRPSS